MFSGLDYSEIGNDQNLLHINPQYCLPVGLSNDVRPDYNGSIDFLESIDKDIPKGKKRFAYLSYKNKKLILTICY